MAIFIGPQFGSFPLLEKEGCPRHQKRRCEATFERSGRGGRFGETFRPKHFAELTTPSALLRWLRDFLLLAQPPLLFKGVNILDESGNSRSGDFEIGRFLHLKSRNPEISNWTRPI